MSGAQIIKTLIAKNGPMTNKALASYIPKFQQELVSKSHMKSRILPQLQKSNILEKKVFRDPASLGKGIADSEKSKTEVFAWKFVDPSAEAQYKAMSL